MAVALGKSCNAVFRAQIYSQNREAGYTHPTGDTLKIIIFNIQLLILFCSGQLRFLGSWTSWWKYKSKSVVHKLLWCRKDWMGKGLSSVNNCRGRNSMVPAKFTDQVFIPIEGIPQTTRYAGGIWLNLNKCGIIPPVKKECISCLLNHLYYLHFDITSYQYFP